MCIAILTTAGKSVDMEVLSKFFRYNSDGGGFAYIKDGKVTIEKGFFKEKEFLDRYAKLLDYGANKNPMLIHARIATTGVVNKDNCHPFPIKGGALIHNGAFFTGGRNAIKSDTRIVAEKLYNILPFEDIMVNRPRVEQAFGGYNKVVILYDDGRYVIINEKNGLWKDGIWYSNFFGQTNSCSVWDSVIQD